MRYLSTRGGVAPVEFQDAVMMGLADDGGLLVPESVPWVGDRLSAWSGLAYPDLALEIFRLFVTDIPDQDLADLVRATYSEANYQGPVAPVRPLGPHYLLELFHGPTLAFKDVALQLLGNLFAYVLSRRGGSLNILAATSGDTGSAAIYGVKGRERIQIFVMHPAGRVSPLQERQMTTVLEANVHNLAIEGSFDDCQGIMKELAGDLEFKREYSLGAVNSVNWARVMAQVVYYFAAFFQTGAASVRFAVPTGNFGDVLAGWYARAMGLPVAELILATNSNDILARFFQTGVYSRGTVYHTLAPAMDIQVASNFERYLYHRAPQQVTRLMGQFASTGRLELAPPDGSILGYACQEQELLETIRRHWQDHQVLLDPHTATGVWAAGQSGLRDLPIICLGTAHPAKFSEAIQRATGQDLAHHPRLEALRDLPTRCQQLPAQTQAVRQVIQAVAIPMAKG